MLDDKINSVESEKPAIDMQSGDLAQDENWKNKHFFPEFHKLFRQAADMLGECATKEIMLKSIGAVLTNNQYTDCATCGDKEHNLTVIARNCNTNFETARLALLVGETDATDIYVRHFFNRKSMTKARSMVDTFGWNKETLIRLTCNVGLFYFPGILIFETQKFDNVGEDLIETLALDPLYQMITMIRYFDLLLARYDNNFAIASLHYINQVKPNPVSNISSDLPKSQLDEALKWEQSNWKINESVKRVYNELHVAGHTLD